MIFKIGILKYFENFTSKHLCWSLFLIKLQTFRLFFTKHLGWLLLDAMRSELLIPRGCVRTANLKDTNLVTNNNIVGSYIDGK